MLVMLAKQKLIGHSGDVVANNDVPRFHLRKLFVGSRHRAGSCQVISEELFEALHGAVAVFADGGVIIGVSKEKALELRIARRCRLTETGQAFGSTPNIVRAGGAGCKNPLLGGFEQVRSQRVQDTLESLVEF